MCIYCNYNVENETKSKSHKIELPKAVCPFVAKKMGTDSFTSLSNTDGQQSLVSLLSVINHTYECEKKVQ